MIDVGDLVRTNGGHYYTVSHLYPSGGYLLSRLKGSTGRGPRRARTVHFVRSFELTLSHQYIADAYRRHAQGSQDLVATALVAAVVWLDRATERGADLAPVLKNARRLIEQAEERTR